MSAKTNNSGTTSNSFSVGNFEAVDGYVKLEAYSPSADPTAPPFIAYSDNDLKWQFSNDGTTIVDLGSGSGPSISDHNDLTLIQGGDTTERYHLTADQHTYLTEDGYINQSAGPLETPVFSYDGAGNLTVADGYVNLYSTTNFTGKLKEYMLTGGIFVLTDGSVNYIVGKYNGGIPIMDSTIDVTDINESDVVPILTVYVDGVNITSLEWGSIGYGMTNRIHKRLVKTERFAWESGLQLTCPFGQGGCSIDVNEGNVWFGANSVHLEQSTSGLGGGTTELWYLGMGGWTASAITVLNSTSYYDTQNFILQNVSQDKYTLNWVFRDLFSTRVIVMLGEGDYTLGEAQASGVPASLPAIVTSTMILVGRIIIKMGETFPAQIDSAFDTKFQVKPPSNHNNLAGLDGGDIGTYYHLIDTDYSWLTANINDGYWSLDKGGLGFNTVGAGDLLYGGVGIINTLPIQASGILTSSGTGHQWSAQSSLSHNSFGSLLGGGAPGDYYHLTSAQNTWLTGLVTDGYVRASKGGIGQVSYAVGDIIYASGTYELSKRTIGSTGQVLTVAAGVPTWASASGADLPNEFAVNEGTDNSIFNNIFTTPVAQTTTWTTSTNEQTNKIANLGNGQVLLSIPFNGSGGTSAVYSKIYKSYNYGKTWEIKYSVPSAYYNRNLSYVTNIGGGVCIAWFSSTARIVRSTDFGETWVEIATSPATMTDCWGITSCENGVVIAVGGPSVKLIARSTDKGLTWARIADAEASEGGFRSVKYIGNGIVLAGGVSSSGSNPFYRSTDYGATWTSVLGFSFAAIWDFANCGNGNIIAATTLGTGIYLSTDSGATWTGNKAPVTNFRSVCYLGNGKAIAGRESAGTIYQSIDYGNNWTLSSLGISPSTVTYHISMLDDRTIIFRTDGNKIYESRTSTSGNTNVYPDGYISVIQNGIPKWKPPAFSKWTPLSPITDFIATAPSATEITLPNSNALFELTNVTVKTDASLSGYPIKILTLPPDGYCPIYNDGGNQISDYSTMTGLTATNVPSGCLYVNIVSDGGSNYHVDIYNDYRKRVGDLIAYTASYSTTGVKALTTQNGSGVGGDITIANVVGVDSDIVVECVKYYTINTYTSATGKAALHGPTLLTTAGMIKQVWVGTTDLVKQVDFFIPGSYSTSGTETLLRSFLKQYIYWKGPPARLTRFSLISDTVTGASEPTVNFVIKTNKTCNANLWVGLFVATAQTVYSTATNLDPRYIAVKQDDILEIATTIGVSADLSLTCTFVSE